MVESIQIRQFTEAGLVAVRRRIESLTSKLQKTKGSQGTPISYEQMEGLQSMAWDEGLTEIVSDLDEIDAKRDFINRMDMAEYICAAIPHKHYDSQIGLWTWLSLVYLNQLLKKNSSGSYLLGSEYRLIPDESRLRFYRHLIRRAWTIHHQYGEKAKLFLSIPCHTHSDFVEQSQKGDILYNRNLVDLCMYLYFDVENSKLKRGASSNVSRPGDFRRLVSVVSRQLYMNFDLFEMSKERLIEVLPSDFKKWMS